jgi:transposase
MPKEFGAWPTVHNRFRQWRDAGVFEALLEGLIAEATKRGEVDLSLVSVDSTTARAHHDAAGIHLGQDVVTALEKAATEEEKARQKGVARKKKGGKGGRPVSHDADLYKERNTVERLINKLKAWRGIATRYDKTPDSYLAGLHLRASMIWIKELTLAAH